MIPDQTCKTLELQVEVGSALMGPLESGSLLQLLLKSHIIDMSLCADIYRLKTGWLQNHFACLSALCGPLPLSHMLSSF